MLTVTDLMPVASEDDPALAGAPAGWLPEHEILRVASCEEGEVELELVYEPRPGFGLEPPRLRDAGRLGVRLETRAGLYTLLTDLDLRVSDGAARGAGGSSAPSC